MCYNAFLWRWCFNCIHCAHSELILIKYALFFLDKSGFSDCIYKEKWKINYLSTFAVQTNTPDTCVCKITESNDYETWNFTIQIILFFKNHSRNETGPLWIACEGVVALTLTKKLVVWIQPKAVRHDFHPSGTIKWRRNNNRSDHVTIFPTLAKKKPFNSWRAATVSDSVYWRVRLRIRPLSIIHLTIMHGETLKRILHNRRLISVSLHNGLEGVTKEGLKGSILNQTARVELTDLRLRGVGGGWGCDTPVLLRP